MPRLLPLDPGLMIDRRPHTAPGRLNQTWSHTYGGQQRSLEQVDSLILSRLDKMRAAFMAVDPERTGLVSRDEFRRVMESLLPVFKKELQTSINEVCESSGETVDYLQFLQRYSRAPAACGASSSRCSVRCFSLNSPMSLSEIQEHLKEKIGGNLKNMIRAFRLFDYNRGGRIQQQEFRRILDSYCIRLTDKEFQRLWNHYSPNNSSTISYEEFLEKLGFGDSHNFRISPVCTKLEVFSRGKAPLDRVKHQKQKPGDPSILPHMNPQPLFFDKMCMNFTSVWQALQAFDSTCSGLVTPEFLRGVLSRFIFPMNPHSFQRLTSRYGVSETGLVSWRHFMGHFRSSGAEKDDTTVQEDRFSKQPTHDEFKLFFQDIYPQLKEIFHLLDQKEAGRVTRADLRHALERPGETQILKPHRRHSQITELLNVLDPQHSGVIELTNLEGLDPGITSAPTIDTSTPESNYVQKETRDADVEQKSSDEIQTTQSDDNASLPPASQRREERLCAQITAALKLFDPQCSGNVTDEDLRTALSCCGISDCNNLLYRLCTSPLSTQQSEKKPQPLLSTLQVAPDVCSILDVVFQRIKSRSEKQDSKLMSKIKDVTQISDGTLSQRDVSKILDECSVILGDKDFNKFTDLLSFRDGRIQSSSFQQKHEGETSADIQQSSEGHSKKEEDVQALLITANQCLAAMKTRIKMVHRDYLSAFRLMDRRRKGVVDRHDFKELYDSLGFFCRDDEYERLLDLIGLHPGGNLNYAEFVDIVENNGKRKQRTQAERVQQQLHELLSSEAQYKWKDMSKILCQTDSDGCSWVHKNSLRRLLFTYSLPLTSEEFDQLWLRIDTEQKGRVAVGDFLKKLGIHHEGGPKIHLKRNQTTQNNHKRPTTSDGVSLERTKLNVSMDDDCERISYKDFLSALENKPEKKSECSPSSPDAGRLIDTALNQRRELVTASAPDLHKTMTPDLAGHQGQKQNIVSGHLHDITKELLELSSSHSSQTHRRSGEARKRLECAWRNVPVKEQKKLQKREPLKQFGAQDATPHTERGSPNIVPPSSPEPTGAVSVGAALQRTRSAPRCSSRHSASVGRPGTGSQAGGVERRLRGVVQHCWKEIQRSCREEDPQKDGVISTACFLKILQSLSISLTQEQFEQLAMKSDIMTNGCVSYQDFLRHFLLNLKPAENQTKFQRRKLPLPTQAAQGVLSKAGMDVILRIYDAIRSSWTPIRRCFLTSDCARTGSVSVQDFRKVLRHFSVNLSEEEFFHLSSYFDGDTTGKICYNNFLWTFLH
ncbi:EF-hand calcium-binding domain-containing protein 6 [Cheilinus undulatus]|uniref:EF-hand calcium-binding domain-containing protein 6 n=1 Tax=Cheilinus undulatus TaxID=241271 RepID=UPI001BD39A7F|nr:EF-hand calcium-binding domain-containing protein 6 [Cheilinus undulatus]